MARHNTLTHISRKNWRYLPNNTLDSMCYNLSLQLQHLASDHKKPLRATPRRALQEIYGTYWYERSWSDLMRVAKLMPKGDSSYMHSPYYFSKCEVDAANKAIEQAIGGCNSAYMHAAQRVFNKAQVKRFCGSYRPYGYANDVMLARAVLGYRIARTVNAKAARNLKSNIDAINMFMWYYNNVYDFVRKDNAYVQYLPEHLRDDIVERYKKSLLWYKHTSNTGVCADETLEYLQYEQLSNIYSIVCRVKYVYDKDKLLTRLYKAIECMYKDAEVIDIIKRYDLAEADYSSARLYGAKYLNKEFVKAMKRIDKTKASDDVKRDMMVRMSDMLREQYPTCGKTGYTPVLTSDDEHKRKLW